MQGNKQLKVAALAENAESKKGPSNEVKNHNKRVKNARAALEARAATRNVSKKKGGSLLRKFREWRTHVRENKTRKAEVKKLRKEHKTLKSKNKPTNKNTERIENIEAMLREVGENV